MRSKVLITGGLGFIGSNLARFLLTKNYDVKIIDNLMLGKTSNVSDIEDKVKIVFGDVRKLEDLKKVKGIDYIVHLASSSASPMFWDNLRGSVDNNIDGYLSVLEFAKDNSVKKVIYATTSSIYGNNKIPLKEEDKVIPPNFYSVTKLAMEYISNVFSKLYKIECIGLRFMSVYGPGEKSKGKFANLASQFLWQMQKDERPVIYGDGRQRRDFTYVLDICRAIELSITCKKKFGSEVFNVGSGKDYSLLELVEIINKTLGKKIEPKLVKNPMLENYIYTQLADLKKIKRLLGYQPKFGLEKGITEISASD